MIRFLLVLVAIGALIWFAASRIPLGMALNQAPLSGMGIQWTQSEGTIWDGRMSGVYVNGQPVGDIDLALRPASLLTLSPAVEVQWGGAGGRGAGVVTLKGDVIEATDLRVEQQVSALESLSNELRAIGGIVRLSGGSVRIENNACTQASGQVQTDTLTRAALQFGREFSDLSGNISCVDGAFNLLMNGSSPAGDTMKIDADASLQGASNIDITVNTSDNDIQMLLAQAGFAQRDGVWTYEYDITQRAGDAQ